MFSGEVVDQHTENRLDTSQCIIENRPEGLDLSKWQELVDLVVELYKASNCIIIQYRQSVFNIVTASENQANFLQPNEQWPDNTKTFCKTIVESNSSLYINDAINHQDWHDMPLVADRSIRSYLGYPIYWPDGSIFGTFCVTDHKETHYDPAFINAINQLKSIVERDLQLIGDYYNIKRLLAEQKRQRKKAQQEKLIRQSMEGALLLQESINSATLDSLVDAVIRIDSYGIILSCNGASEKIFGYQANELINQNIKILAEPEHSKHHDTYIANYKRSGVAKIVGKTRQVNAKRKSGELFPIQLSVSEIKVGDELQFIGLISDITEKVKYEKQLTKLALYDSLTECANRNLMAERFQYQIKKSKRNHSQFSIAYIDLNKFKPINDRFGHAAGDYVLIETAGRLRTAVRANDLIARLGGDEFVIIFDNEINASSVVEQLSEELQSPMQFNSLSLFISASIGVATYPGDGETIETLLEAADIRMLKHKKTHSTRECFNQA